MTFLISCGGDGDGPQITITSPSDGDTFAVGDDLTISFTVTDDVDIARINVSSEALLNLSDYPGLEGETDTSVPVMGVFTLIDPNQTGDFTITVTANDSDGNTTTESVDITVQ